MIMPTSINSILITQYILITPKQLVNSNPNKEMQAHHSSLQNY